MLTIDDLLDAIKNRNVDGARAALENLTRQGLPSKEILNKSYGYAKGFQEYEIDGIPFHMAAFLNDGPMLKLLSEYGADPSIVDIQHRTALCAALHGMSENTDDIGNKVSFINRLWVPGIDPETPIEHDNLKFLVDNILKRTQKPSSSLTAPEEEFLKKYYFYTVFEDFIKTISNVKKMKYFLEHPKVSIINPYTQKALFTINLGVIRDKNHHCHALPVLVASEINHVEALEYLSKHYRFSLDVCDADGNTPLHYAIRKPSYNAIHFLVQHGADTSLTNKYGETALDLCKKIKRKDEPDASAWAEWILINAKKDACPLTLQYKLWAVNPRPIAAPSWDKDSLPESEGESKDPARQAAAKRARWTPRS